MVAGTLAGIVQQAPITGIFRTKERAYGHKPNADNYDPSILWTHFHGEVDRKHLSVTPDKARGDARSGHA